MPTGLRNKNFLTRTINFLTQKSITVYCDKKDIEDTILVYQKNGYTLIKQGVAGHGQRVLLFKKPL